MAEREQMSFKVMMELTLPTFGFSTALAMVITYLPVILRDKGTTSATLIGFAIGGEGIFALGIPIVVGVISDRIWTRWGRRRPFMIVAAPFMAAALMLAPFQPGYVSIALSVFVFFIAYHFYTAPYQALIPDITPPGLQGRVQGYQTSMRGSGMFLGMVVAGALFAWWKPSPFLLTGVILVGITYLTVSTIHEQRPDDQRFNQRASFKEEIRSIWESTKREKGIQRLLVANFLWESTIAGIRPFIMLFFIYAMHVNERTGGFLLGLMGVVYVVAALVSGYAADKYGRKRVMFVGLCIYIAGCVTGYFVRSLEVALLLMPIFGLGGSIVLTLPYALLVRMMPKDRVGQFTGIFSMTRGLATITAPVITGAVVDATAPFLQDSRGYATIWPVAAVALIISLFFLRLIPGD